MKAGGGLVVGDREETRSSVDAVSSTIHHSYYHCQFAGSCLVSLPLYSMALTRESML